MNVYPSSVYPTTATSSTSTTYLDTTSTTYAGLPTSTSDTNQSQLVSYGVKTFLIQLSPDGSSTPLIMVVSRQDTESPSIVSPGEVVSSVVSPGEVVSPSHSLSYITCVSPATIQWLIANYEAAEGVALPKSTLYIQCPKRNYVYCLPFLNYQCPKRNYVCCLPFLQYTHSFKREILHFTKLCYKF